MYLGIRYKVLLDMSVSKPKVHVRNLKNVRLTPKSLRMSQSLLETITPNLLETLKRNHTRYP